jgi:hypothetical protein
MKHKVCFQRPNACGNLGHNKPIATADHFRRRSVLKEPHPSHLLKVRDRTEDVVQSLGAVLFIES